MAVTMDDVAARAGVSRAAVRFALRNSPKVSAVQRAHIARIGRENLPEGGRRLVAVAALDRLPPGPV